MSSDSDFQVDEVARAGSQPDSRAPFSPRKRRRSESTDPLRDRKRHLDGKYNDGYRNLFNETVNSIVFRYNADGAFQHYTSQVGASKWSPKEKSMFFAALERLGKDDIPGISEAIGTKSIPETRDFFLLLQDSASKQGDARVTLRDIAAAIEIGSECDGRLELAGDALAWYQERFEAKQEQDRFGKYWLITSELADDVEDALKPTKPATMSSSPPATANDKDKDDVVQESDGTPQIMLDLPEANLLCPSAFLTLSTNVFMNGSSTTHYPWPHWSELTSELAVEPSIYRTAFNDFHSLVISLTKRLVQVALIQATSRIRSRGWRVKKGVGSFVKKRDVFTATGILGLKRNGRERWRGAARRCGLRIFDGKGREKREMSWNEVEKTMSIIDRLDEPSGTDTETAGMTSGAEDSDDFNKRAMRSGTPLPTTKLRLSDSEEDDDSDKEYEAGESEADDESIIHSSASPTSPLSDPTTEPNSVRSAPEYETSTLEEFDQEARQQVEGQLLELLGFTPPEREESTKLEEGVSELELKGSNKVVTGVDDWRLWTEYQAAWETFLTPISLPKFLANQKASSPGPMPQSTEVCDTDSDMQTTSPSAANKKGKKRRKANEAEIPIRGARAYAALQERATISKDQMEDLAILGNNTKWPAESIEDADQEDAGIMASVEDVLDGDANPTSDSGSI